MMKKLILFLITALCTVACSTFDDSAILEQLRDHEERIQALEAQCRQLNTNIGALQTIVAALQENDYVTNVGL